MENKDLLIKERAKNIVGAPYSTVIENLEWLVSKTREMALKEIVASLEKMEFYVDWGGESAKALRDKIVVALKQGKIPE